VALAGCTWLLPDGTIVQDNRKANNLPVLSCYTHWSTQGAGCFACFDEFGVAGDPARLRGVHEKRQLSTLITPIKNGAHDVGTHFK